MPGYSPSSIKRLLTADPGLRSVFKYVIGGFDHTVICGHRGQAEQDRAFGSKKSQLRWPFSPHNQLPSDAIDAGPYNPETRQVDWPDPEVSKVVLKSHPSARKFIKTLARWYYFGGFVMGVAFALGIELRWGGDWDGDTMLTDQNFDDLPHFERIHERPG